MGTDAEKLMNLGNLPPKMEEEKKEASAQIKLFDYADIIRGHIRQEVPIGNQMVVTFQTLNGKEDLWLRKRTGDFTGESVDYVSSWYRNAELSLAIVDLSFNGEAKGLPPVQYDGDKPIDDSVDQRLDALLSMLPNVILNKLALHHSWFLERVSEEFSGGALKNG
jgi:hypothetical protein